MPTPDRGPGVLAVTLPAVTLPAVTLLAVTLLAVTVLAGCQDGPRAAVDPDRASTGTVTGPSVASPSVTAPVASPSVSGPATGAATSGAPSPTTMSVPTDGTGDLVTVPGSVPAPGRGRPTTVRVQVERGVDVDPADFAAQVMRTLNDPRSWGHGGVRTFARSAGPAQVTVLLASPTTSARLCRPLRTFGRLSCRAGDRAVLTSYRWAHGTEEFPDLAVYRQYVVNHEVGHVLGHGHQRCPGAGRPAPVMQQQTKQVAPCRPNAWPFP